MNAARIAHLSDLHFGKIVHPGIVDALINELNGQEFDLVVVSGDLTQRARSIEYQAASAMLTALHAPTLVVPGNHDVYPWWRPISRVFQPLVRFRRHITADKAPTFRRAGLAVLGVNSAHGRTVKGGKIGHSERAAMKNFFEEVPAGDFKVLVIHHHLTQIQALGPHDVARKARRALDLAGELRVDLILCGHLHISHIEPLEIIPETHRVVIASAGTSTSSRGRREHRMTNFYNIITVDATSFTVEERRFDPDNDHFVEDRTTRFDRDWT